MSSSSSSSVQILLLIIRSVTLFTNLSSPPGEGGNSEAKTDEDQDQVEGEYPSKGESAVESFEQGGGGAGEGAGGESLRLSDIQEQLEE